MSDTDVERVATGYDAVYAGIAQSPTFARLWREHSLGDDYPAGFEHISFLTLREMRSVAEALRLDEGATLVDLGCGMGGPGLWVASETGARLVGIDISKVGLAHARKRAETLGLHDVAEFRPGTFAATGLQPSSVDAVMTIDAFQYAPDKHVALAEIARVLRPGGVLALVCFEVDPSRVEGLPVFGTNPVADYRPLLQDGGLDVLTYTNSVDWRRRVIDTYQAVTEAREALTAEMGAAAYAALSGEVFVTLQLQPYCGRPIAVARKG